MVFSHLCNVLIQRCGVSSKASGAIRLFNVHLASFLQGATGRKHASEKRYRVLRERVQTAVANYGKTDVLTYLRAIAHLSYS